MQISFEQRVVIYRAAHGLLTKDQLEPAIKSWQAKDVGFDPTQFAKHCAQAAGLDSNQLATFQKKLIELSPEGGATGVPAVASRTPPRPAPTLSPSKQSADKVVFGFLVSKILGRLQSHGMDRLNTTIKPKLSKARLPMGYEDLFKTWLAGTTPPDQLKYPSLTQSQMKEIMDHLYGWTCSVLGPVKTDRVFSTIFKQAELLPEANSFAPRKLL